MNDDQDNGQSEADEEFERELRQARKFTPTEALARMAGPGAMKGASPVSRVQQAETEIGTWLRAHVADADGALQVSLHRRLRGSELLLHNLDEPLIALREQCELVLASDYLLTELVREADVEWGQRMGERPHFSREDSQPSPDDPYTVESVRAALGELLTKLAGAKG